MLASFLVWQSHHSQFRKGWRIFLIFTGTRRLIHPLSLVLTHCFSVSSFNSPYRYDKKIDTRINQSKTQDSTSMTASTATFKPNFQQKGNTCGGHGHQSRTGALLRMLLFVQIVPKLDTTREYIDPRIFKIRKTALASLELQWTRQLGSP